MKSKLAILSFILSIFPILYFLILSSPVFMKLLDFITDTEIFFLIFWVIIPILSLITSIISIIIIKKNKLEGIDFSIAALILLIIFIFIIYIFMFMKPTY